MQVSIPNAKAEDVQLLLYVSAHFQRLRMGSQVAARKMCVDCEGRVAVKEEMAPISWDRTVCRRDLLGHTE